MDVVDECSQWDVQCAYCITKFRENRGCGIHFVLRHVFDYFDSAETPCPVCQSLTENVLLHIFMDHPSTCLYCLKDTFDGIHLHCFETVEAAVKEICGNLVYLPMFSNRCNGPN